MYFYKDQANKIVNEDLNEDLNEEVTAEEIELAEEGEEFELDEFDVELSEEELEEEEISEMNTILQEKGPKKTRTIVVKTKKQKLALMKQQAAMDMAKEEGDSLYKRYQKARKIEINLREKIEKKYKSKANASVRKKISKSK